jgi:hypothetical protein
MSGIIGAGAVSSSGVIGRYPSGHVIQTTTVNTGYTSTNVSGFTDMPITTSIIPKSTNSKILVHASWISYVHDTSGDHGYIFRWKKVDAGGTTYPAHLYDYDGSGIYYGSRYMNTGTGDGALKYYFNGQDDQSTTAIGDTATYTLNIDGYNITNTFWTGGGNNSQWTIFLQEVQL